jgi:Carboxypeptidase regulatory-like domain
MTRPLRHVSLVLIVCISASTGCQSSSIPTSPTASAPPLGPARGYTLSGVALGPSPTGVSPIEGARVEVGDLRVYVGGLRVFAITDKDGFYTIAGLPAGSTGVRVIKYGFEIDTKTVNIAGDIQLDIQLVSRALYTLSGMVFEGTPNGPVAVEGVWVYCDSCGEFGHTGVYTDAQGFYSFPGVYNGSTTLIVRKPGYAVINPTRTFADGAGGKDAIVSGDTRFDIEIGRR